MDKPTIQDIFIRYGEEYTQKYKLSNQQWKLYHSIRNCKTGGLGIHIITCKNCAKTTKGNNSCRNRHCPMCQSYAREKWIQKQLMNQLNCSYFHIVTTIPHELNELIQYNDKEIYQILFQANSEAILELASDKKWLGAKVGITSMIHTWGQKLDFHPHIHSIVTGGGLRHHRWISCEKDYLFQVQVLSSLFKGKVLTYLKEVELKLPNHLSHLKNKKAMNDFLRPLYKKDWVANITSTKGSPEAIIEYLGRYAFRVAIANERILDIENGQVTFEYKDNKDNEKRKKMTLSAIEFIRRFLMHILPANFMKIRSFGIFSNRTKNTLIKLCRILLRQIMMSDFTIKIKRKLHKFKCEKCGGEHFHYQFLYAFHPLLQ